MGASRSPPPSCAPSGSPTACAPPRRRPGSRREQLAEYRNAVADFEVAFDVAERDARRLKDSSFTEVERKRLDTAKQLLTVAIDQAATPAERQIAYRRVREELDGLISLSDGAIEVLETQVMLEITTGPVAQADAGHPRPRKPSAPPAAERRHRPQPAAQPPPAARTLRMRRRAPWPVPGPQHRHRARAASCTPSRTPDAGVSSAASGGGAATGSECASIHASMRANQSNSHAACASRSSGISRSGHPPRVHRDALVHRQRMPHVAECDEVLEAGVRDEDDVGVARRERRVHAARVRRHHVREALGALGHRFAPDAAEPVDAAADGGDR